jgi:hypothetical protein
MEQLHRALVEGYVFFHGLQPEADKSNPTALADAILPGLFRDVPEVEQFYPRHVVHAHVVALIQSVKK